MNRRQFFGLAGAAAIGVGLYSGEYERHHLVVEEHAITLPNLADAFHGMRVVQISDIHYDEFTEPYFVKEAVARVNALKPDLVALTGDFISMGPLPRHIGARLSYPCAALLQAIECPLRYAVLGNHDAIVNMSMVTDALETHGIPVLANSYVPIERDGRRIWLGGVRDVSVRLARVEEAVPKTTIKNGDPLILLAHEPDYADHVARVGGVDLMLSGHSHGGQVRLPFLPPLMLPPLGKKYVEGLFHIGNTQLYVNRGIGTVGLPLRLDCPPEITVFTLTPG
jgi:predicted MPP superfamily phosphohydrolase